MNKRANFILLITLAVLILTACNNTVDEPIANQEPSEALTETASPEPTAEPTPEPTKEPTPEPTEIVYPHRETVTISSNAIGSNLLDESPEREIHICLPTSYNDTNKSYPVVIFLEGYGTKLGSLYYNYKRYAQQMTEDGNQEFIMVTIDGINSLGGSMYANSPVIGNWEDFIAIEVVDYLDANYRTIPKSSARGISGFSMGATGAINIALNHPDVFSCVYSSSPSLFAVDGLEEVYPEWRPYLEFLTAYGAAYNPDPDGDEMHGAFPAFDGTPEDAVVVKNWENGFGNLAEKIDNYMLSDAKLSAIWIETGDGSEQWMLDGCEYFGQLMADTDIEYTYYEFAGQHSLPHTFSDGDFVSFFSKHLVSE